MQKENNPQQHPGLLHENNTDEADRFTFFELIYNRFLLAEQKAGANNYTFNIAGHPIQLRFAGPAMTPHLLPALKHLIVETNDNPELTICVWDCASTGTRIPLLASIVIQYCASAPYNALGPRREINNFSSNRLFTYFVPGPSILNLMDADQNLAIYWINDASQMPFYEKSNPFKPILNWWMNSTELVIIHAAGVGNSEGGVLIPGKSESGKSTTALACLNSDLNFLSDDSCAVTTESPPFAYSLYGSGRLNGENDLARLPHLSRFVSNPVRVKGEKALVFINQHQPDKIIKNYPVKAILVPHITHAQETRILPASSKEALMSLAPSSILQLPNAGKRNMHIIANLVRQIPCFSLELGSNIDSIPVSISHLLDGL